MNANHRKYKGSKTLKSLNLLKKKQGSRTYKLISDRQKGGKKDASEITTEKTQMAANKAAKKAANKRAKEEADKAKKAEEQKKKDEEKAKKTEEKKKADEEKQKKAAEKKQKAAEEKAKKAAAKQTKTPQSVETDKVNATSNSENTTKTTAATNNANTPNVSKPTLSLDTPTTNSSTEDDTDKPPSLELEGDKPSEETSIDTPKSENKPAGEPNKPPSLELEGTTPGENETSTDEGNETEPATSIDESGEPKKKWTVKGTFKNIGKTLKKPFVETKNLLKNGYKMAEKGIYNIGDKYDEVKEKLGDIADKYSLTKWSQKRKMNKLTIKAARGALKMQKYDELRAEKSEEISAITAQMQGLDPKSKEYKALQSKQNQLTREMKFYKKKQVEWIERQSEKQSKVNEFKKEIAAKVAPLKAKIDANLKSQVSGFRDDLAKKRTELETEHNDKFTAFDNEITAINANTGITQEEKAKQIAAVEAKKSGLKTEIEQKMKQEESKLQSNIIDLYGKDIERLTRSLGISGKVAQPGTPENEELQTKIKEHLAKTGQPPDSKTLSEFITQTGYKRTLQKKSIEMTEDLMKSTTAKVDKYRDTQTALGTINNPLAKKGVITRAIADYTRQLNIDTDALIAKQKQGKLTPVENKKLDKYRQIRNAITYMRGTQNATDDEIYKYISSQDVNFGEKITGIVSDMASRRKVLENNTKDLEQKAQALYDQKINNKTSQSTKEQYARLYLPASIKNQKKLSEAEINQGLAAYKAALKQRILENPLLLDNLKLPSPSTTTSELVLPNPSIQTPTSNTKPASNAKPVSNINPVPESKPSSNSKPESDANKSSELPQKKEPLVAPQDNPRTAENKPVSETAQNIPSTKNTHVQAKPNNLVKGTNTRSKEIYNILQRKIAANPNNTVQTKKISNLATKYSTEITGNMTPQKLEKMVNYLAGRNKVIPT